MTRVELKKRLKFVKSTPLDHEVVPRDGGRRDVNSISNESEYDLSEFDSFSDYEDDLADMESARIQTERVEIARINSENQARSLGLNITSDVDIQEEVVEEIAEEGFVMFEEENIVPSGDSSSFFTFVEDDAGGLARPVEKEIVEVPEDIGADDTEESKELDLESWASSFKS